MTRCAMTPGVRPAFFVFLLWNLMLITDCQQQQDNQTLPNGSTDLEKLTTSIKYLAEKTHFYKFFNNATKFLIQNLPFPKEISHECVGDVKYFFSELTDTDKSKSNVKDNWAIQMMDSMAKPPAGVLAGDLFWLGRYQQCLNVAAKKSHESEMAFTGEYCLAEMSSSLMQGIENSQLGGALTIKIGLCFPSTCSFQDKSTLIRYMLTPLTTTVDIRSSLTEELCQTKKKKPMDVATIIIISVFLLSGVFVLLATMMDLKMSMEAGSWVKILASFSAIKSLKTIFHQNEVKSELSSIHGIRVLSIGLVVFGHTFMFSAKSYAWKNQLDVLNAFDYFVVQPFIFNATYSVTTFFVISGFLVTYLFMQQISKRNGRLNIFGYYVYRYLRLTPPLFFVILFLIGPFYYLNDGPIWPILHSRQANCQSLWWQYVLYIQSILQDVNSERLRCIPQAWYLSADTQLYFFAPIVLYPLYRKPFVGLVMLGVIFILSVTFSMFHIATHKYETYNGRNSTRDETIAFLNDAYTQTHYHISTYVIGMAAGYLYHVCQTKHIVLTKRITIPCWISAIAVILAIEYGTYPYFKGSSSMGPVVNVIYGALARPAWSMALSWIIIASARGHGGIINRFLSLSIFTPLSRLTYSAYLTHMFVLDYYFYGQKDSLYFSFYNLVIIAISNFLLTMIVATILAVLIELPIIEVLKQLGEIYDEKYGAKNKQQSCPLVGRAEEGDDSVKLLAERRNYDDYDTTETAK